MTRSLCNRNIQARSIPACAGEPRTFPGSEIRADFGVYPRVCGGTGARLGAISPTCLGSRSIPACAGEPWTREPRLTLQQVYPRVCGGTSPCRRVKARRTAKSQTVYPRVCGGTGASLDPMAIAAHDTGLSPRVRGNLILVRLEGVPRLPGLSPRVRGNRQISRLASNMELGARGLSPRVRGNRRKPVRITAMTGTGLSPRVRGNLKNPHGWDLASVYRVCGGTSSGPTAYERSIPACAGEPSSCAAHRTPMAGLSPRVRGNHLDRLGRPAREPSVYPRVCGGTGIARPGCRV